MDEQPEPRSRKAAKAALRSAGFSHREVDGLLRLGWAGVVDVREAEAAELRDQVESLRSLLRGAGIGNPEDPA